MLEELNVPYHITGGFAARIYGAERELADIDIEVPDKYLKIIAREAFDYVIFGPGRYRDDTFDIQLMTLKKDEQEVDIVGSDSVRLFDKEMQQWFLEDITIEKAEQHEVYNKLVPIVSKESLIAYKRRIARDVDLEDVKQLTVK